MNQIDPTKKYMTRSGKRVVGIVIVQYNSCGDAVTFPVKGSIIVRDKPRKFRYQIWKIDGSAAVRGEHPDDLIEVI